MIQTYGSLLLVLQAVELCKWTADAGGIDGATLVDPERRSNLRKTLLGSIEEYCRSFEIKPALDRIARIKTVLDNPFDCTHASMRHQLQTLYENIEDDLKIRLFWYIPQAKLAHFLGAKDIPFEDGPDLAKARIEWFEAEHCYALERHTACVMHLMRLAELGLRTLARRLVGDTIGGRALEFVDWKPMLDAVEPIIAQNLKGLANQGRTAERERQVSFYSSVTSHLRYFKTIRDEAAHARGLYDEGQALSALQRVEEFMVLLTPSKDSS